MTTLRPIERGTFADVIAPESFGPAPQLQWIAIDKLVVDDSYQRPLDSQHSRKSVRAIASCFDWRRFAPVIVSPLAGGRYAIVDGQHRATAALLVGIEQVPCNVILADRNEQARAFEAVNGQTTKILPIQIFKAQLLRGEPEAVRIINVAKSAGVKVLLYKASSLAMKAGETQALIAITRMIKQFGDASTAVALRFIRTNAGDLNGYLTAPIITAVTIVLADHPEWRDDPRLIPLSDRIDLNEAWRTACRRAHERRGTTSQDQFQALLVTHFDAVMGAKAA